MDCEDSCHNDAYPYSAAESWSRITEVLRDGYRRRAERILRIVQETK